MDDLQHGTSGRRRVFWLTLVVAASMVTVQVVEGPPGSGYGWGSVVVSCVLLAVPLVAVGLMVRSGDSRYGWAAVIVVALLTVIVLLALVGNWSGQPSSSRALDSMNAVLVLVLAVGVLAVELPLLRRGPRDRGVAGPR